MNRALLMAGLEAPWGAESERELYREETYQEIVRNVDRLISDISAASLLTLVAYKIGTLLHR
jgi:hypothetical protein